MTRFESLERVLEAARVVFEAREDHMLTQVEWDALAASVRSVDGDGTPAQKPTVRIVFEDGLMFVMDEQNQGYDCLDLGDCSQEYAAGQLNRWAAEYSFDGDAARTELNEYFEALDAE